MGTQDAEHPHRCREGHCWQHAGPSAVTCEIPVYDSETNDLTIVSAQDCPVCSGREDLLVRDLHSHYCNTCAGEWDHDGRCLDGWAASCPWCFPLPDAVPVPGARRGPHFHFCPECAQSWQHDASCAAALRAVLPECSGCRTLSADLAAADRAAVDSPAARRAARPRASFSPSRPRVSPTDVVQSLHGLVTSTVLLASVAAALMTIPILFLVSSSLWTVVPHSRSPVDQQGTDPAFTRSKGSPGTIALPAEPPTERIRPSASQRAQVAVATPPRSSAGAQLLHRNGERREEESSPTRRADRPAPAVQPDRAAPSTDARTAGLEHERAPSSSPPQSANPDAPQRGGAALDVMAKGSPQLSEVRAPRRDLPTWSEESPRWDRASLSVMMNAVVDIRPMPRALPIRPQAIRGFIIDELGHVVTSNRRLGDSTALEVTLLDGRRLGATVVVRNWLNDIALLRLDRRGPALIALGDSHALAVGDRVAAIGDAGGRDRVVMPATILATGAGTGGNLAIDLSPTPDGVGGPLLNSVGQAVGIVVDAAPSTGGSSNVTFAVPVDRVKSLLRDLSTRSTADLKGLPEAR